MKSGFTLIELLIVIGIIGILAAVVLVGIDPVDKINAANDTKVIRDINALATAMESYAINNNGTYAIDQPTLINAGDLKTTLRAPSGYTDYGMGGGATGILTSQLKSKKYVNAGTPAWVWCSTSGRAEPTVDRNTCP